MARRLSYSICDGRTSTAQQVIAVIGGTGTQGGGVVDALLASGAHSVRVGTRDPAGAAAKALSARGVQMVRADVLDANSLLPLFEGAHGAFLVTNFWAPEQTQRETAIGADMVTAARAAGVHHVIWSTLPDCEKLSGGRLKVVHFSGKAHVDSIVAAAGFPRYTFVAAPFYFQNLATVMGPQPLPTGGRGWAVPMDPAARVIHAGDASEVGRAVAAAFAAGDAVPNGSYLGACGGVYSWNDFVEVLNAQRHALQVIQVPGPAYDTFYPGAHEMRATFEYFEQFTYFGPHHEAYLAATSAIVPGGFTGFAEWARVHLKAT